MNGAIVPHTPIAVDVWNKKAVSSCRLFFLSHAHTDHTAGLTSSWKHHKIYCSEVTKNIVIHKLGVCNELLVGIPVDKSISIPMDEYGQEKLTVTLIDANHCPGAVMFLFEGYFGTVLYTGDFRYDKGMTDHSALKDKIIDRLYLDNTYCDPMCLFPSREEALSKVLDIVEDHLKKDFKIVFGMSALGKEDLLVQIAIAHRTWIGVDPKRLSLLKLLKLPDVFTSDVESTRVRVVMQREVTKQSLQEWNDINPTIVILPTALFEGDINPYQYMSNVFVVPFSDHSSYEELVTFVSSIQPKEIIPIVLKHRCTRMEPNNTRTNMAIFNSYLNKEPFIPVLIPDSVLKYMNPSTTKNLRVKRRSNSRYNCYDYKRRKCAGVVFPEDKPTIAIESKSEDKATKELPNSNKTCLQNDSLYGKRRIESSYNGVQVAECHNITTQDPVQNDSLTNNYRIELCYVLQPDECHTTSTQDSFQCVPVRNKVEQNNSKTTAEFHSKNSFPTSSPSMDHSSLDIKMNSYSKEILDNKSSPDKKNMVLINAKSDCLENKDERESLNISKSTRVEKDLISKKHLIGDEMQRSKSEGPKKNKCLLDYWGYQKLPSTKTAITSDVNNSNNHYNYQTTAIPPKSSSNTVKAKKYCTDFSVSGTTTLSCPNGENTPQLSTRTNNQLKSNHKKSSTPAPSISGQNKNNSEDDSLHGFCWFTSDFDFTVKK